MSENNEELFEEGIVESISEGIATIAIVSSASCEECSAKVYCKPKDSDARKLMVKESLGVEIGDKVRISIKGKNLLLASLYLYGIPLIILLGTLITGISVFKSNPELFSFFAAIGFLSAYFVFLWTISTKLNRKKAIIPEIVAVYKVSRV